MSSAFYKQPSFMRALGIAFIFLLVLSFQNCSQPKTGGELDFGSSNGSNPPGTFLKVQLTDWAQFVKYTKSTPACNATTGTPLDCNLSVHGKLVDSTNGNPVAFKVLRGCARTDNDNILFTLGGCATLFTDANGVISIVDGSNVPMQVNYCTATQVLDNYVAVAVFSDPNADPNTSPPIYFEKGVKTCKLMP